MKGDKRLRVHLGADRSLQLLDRVHLVTTREGGQPRILLSLDRCIKLIEIELLKMETKQSTKRKISRLSRAAPCFVDSPSLQTLASRHIGPDALPLALVMKDFYRLFQYSGCKMIQELELNDADDNAVMVRHSLFLMQKQTPRDARNKQRTEMAIDRDALHQHHYH